MSEAEIDFFKNLLIGLGVALPLGGVSSYLRRRGIISARVAYYGLYPVIGGVAGFFMARGVWIDQPPYVHLLAALGLIAFAEVMTLCMRWALLPREEKQG